MSYSLADLQNILRQAGWPDIIVSSASGQVPLIALMAAIGMAESSGNPQARNDANPTRERSYGLWQINLNAHTEYTHAQMQDPLSSAQAALAVYNQQGLRAWGAYTDGRYRTYGHFNDSLSIYGGVSQAPIADESSSDFLGLPIWMSEADQTGGSVPAWETIPNSAGPSAGTMLGLVLAIGVVAWLIS